MGANPAASVRAGGRNPDHQSQVAFFLSGKRQGANLEAVPGSNLRPALLARYRDLTALRHDFPVVLVRDADERTWVQCLSGVIDGVLNEVARDDDGDRVTKHVLRLEQAIRAICGGQGGPLPALWDAAATRLAAGGDALLADSLKRARAALRVAGDVAACDASMPTRLLGHAWRIVQERKRRAAGEDVRRLIQKLSDILVADRVRSDAGRSPERLRAAVGTIHAEVFDFEVMARMLAKGKSRASLSDARRRRIEMLLSVLGSQRFFPAAAAGGPAAPGEGGYVFAFDDCTRALAAYRERLPMAVQVARALAMAELEIAGEYDETKHDALFSEFGDGDLAREDEARFPDYLICVNASRLTGEEGDRLMEMLSAGLPVKILVQTDDLLDDAPATGDAHLTFGTRGTRLASMAMGLNEVYVLQSAASNLFQDRERILRGMEYAGPALFNVYSGAGGRSGAPPPYLDSAAAMEARVFPAYTYDPSAGPNWAARFHLGDNPQVESDWPIHDFCYEDENHRRIVERIAFTPIDFLCCDPRYARHFARVPRAGWNETMVPVGDFLALEAGRPPEKVPCVLMVDDHDMLQKAIVDEKLLRLAHRCRETWHSLQELGGIHNSHAERLLAREKRAWEEHELREAAARPPEPGSGPPTAKTADLGTAVRAAAPASVDAGDERTPDDAYIETPRCTSCNECTQINDKMFAYDENKQARIVDPDAGTYRQLVEAAESCQVAIIHPGKPRNPGEAGLDELLQRAEPFR